MIEKYREEDEEFDKIYEEYLEVYKKYVEKYGEDSILKSKVLRTSLHTLGIEGILGMKGLLSDSLKSGRKLP